MNCRIDPAARRPYLDRGNCRRARGYHLAVAAPIKTPRATSKNIEPPFSLEILPSVPNPFDTRLVARGEFDAGFHAVSPHT